MTWQNPNLWKKKTKDWCRVFWILKTQKEPLGVFRTRNCIVNAGGSIVAAYAKNIHQLHQPFFSHGPSNSTRVKHYQTFIFLSTHFIHAQRFFWIIKVLGHHERPQNRKGRHETRPVKGRYRKSDCREEEMIIIMASGWPCHNGAAQLQSHIF